MNIFKRKKKITIYVASSWRNRYQPNVVEHLLMNGFDVYDFRHPDKDNIGFNWKQVDTAWKHWSIIQYFKALNSKIAKNGFKRDYKAMKRCNYCVLVLPSGASSHLEAGFFVGNKNKKLIIYMPEMTEPELMYNMADHMCNSITGLLSCLRMERRKLN